MGKGTAIADRQGACAFFADINPSGTYVESRARAIHKNSPIGARIDRDPHPPVVIDRSTCGHIEVAVAAIGPAEEQVAATGRSVIEDASA